MENKSIKSSSATNSKVYCQNPEKVFEAMVDVNQNCLGNKRADDYATKVKDMINAYAAMKVNMSLKIHFLVDHLNFFPSNCGDCSDQQGERFHQDLATMEKRFNGKDPRNMLGEYCWSLCRETELNRPYFPTYQSS